MHVPSPVTPDACIAAAPHLHETLAIELPQPLPGWPKPLQEGKKLGLLPFVKKPRIHGFIHRCISSLKQFNHCTLPCFLKLTNVQELGIDFLDISQRSDTTLVNSYQKFEPSLLGNQKDPVGRLSSCQHLKDLRLLYDAADLREGPADDITLVPPSIHPLRGRLTMTCFTRVGILEESDFVTWTYFTCRGCDSCLTLL